MLRVCYFGTYRASYSRNQMMIAGLRMNGAEVIECHETLWQGIEDRVQAVRGGWLKPAFWVRVVRAYLRLLRKYTRIEDYDVLVVGYPGVFDIFLARILTWIKHKPLVWDVFMSIYLISVERNLDKANGFTVKLLHFFEGLALRQPDRLILDTSEYVKWFRQCYGTASERFCLVPTGADDRVFCPAAQVSPESDGFRVVYFGTFIPNHGVMFILEAARELASQPELRFEMIGEGPELGRARQYASDYHLDNVKFLGWKEAEELNRHINQADICLGAFGETPQSLMTVQNKIYQAVATGKPLITGDSPAIRQVFTHGENIFLCQRANGHALAEAILELKDEPGLRASIAQSGYQLFSEQYDLLHNGRRFCACLSELVG